MNPKNKLGNLLNHLSFVLARQSDQILQERLGIGFSQYKIMMVLRQNPHIQQKVIADRLGQTEASISRQIKLLLQQGLLHTVKRPENRREHITTLTGRGERFIDEAEGILNSYHSPVFNNLNDKQQASTIEALKLMHKVACDANRPNGCHHSFEKL